VKSVNNTFGILLLIILVSSNLTSQHLAKRTNEDFHYKTSEQMKNLLVVQNQLNSNATLNSTGSVDPHGLRERVQKLWSILDNRHNNNWRTKIEHFNLKVSTKASTVVSRSTNYSWDGSSSWVNSGWWENEADGDGVIVKQVSYDNLGAPHQEIYNNGPYTNGQPAVVLSLIDNGSGWENWWQNSYTYNSDGDVVEMVGENWDGSIWVLSWRGVITYIQPGIQSTYTNYADDNGTWIAGWRSTNIYGEPSYITEMVPYQPWPLLTGNPTQIIDEVSDDNGATWTSSATHTYSDLGADYLPRTYNYSNGFQDRSFFEYTAVPGGKVSSVYDNSNLRCTKQTTQNFTDGVWINSTETFYGYEGLELVLDTESETAIPDKFVLAQNYPNPFNPNTNIDFSLSEESDVKLSIYDLSGKLIKEIVNAPMQIGRYSILWNGTDTNGNKAGAGVYLYKLQTDNFSQTKKMILLK